MQGYDEYNELLRKFSESIKPNLKSPILNHYFKSVRINWDTYFEMIKKRTKLGLPVYK